MDKSAKTSLFFIFIVAAAVTGYLLLPGRQNRQAKNSPVPSVSQGAWPAQPSGSPYDFTGDKGKQVILENNRVQISAAELVGNEARFFNVLMPSGKTIYFFVVKDKNGIYRAAANACQVCFSLKKGFHQEGNEIVCNNCGNRYPLEKIATEKGGCNPAPINPNVKLDSGFLTIIQSELEQVEQFF